MSLNLLSLDAHFPKTKYFPATGFATDLRVDHQTVKDTCHFWATHGNTKLGFIYMRWIFTECTMEFIIKPRFGRVLFNFFPSSTIYLEKKLLGGLGWWLGFLGFPYDYYSRGSLEFQTTRPPHHHPFTIRWSFPRGENSHLFELSLCCSKVGGSKHGIKMGCGTARPCQVFGWRCAMAFCF